MIVVPDYRVVVQLADGTWLVHLREGGREAMAPMPIGTTSSLTLYRACTLCETVLQKSGLYLLGGWRVTGVGQARATVRKARELVRSGHMSVRVAS